MEAVGLLLLNFKKGLGDHLVLPPWKRNQSPRKRKGLGLYSWRLSHGLDSDSNAHQHCASEFQREDHWKAIELMSRKFPPCGSYSSIDFSVTRK